MDEWVDFHGVALNVRETVQEMVDNVASGKRLRLIGSGKDVSQFVLDQAKTLGIEPPVGVSTLDTASEDAMNGAWEHLPKPPPGHPNHDVLRGADAAIGGIRGLLNDPDIRHSFANLLENMEGNLHESAKSVSHSEYSVAFVGDIGVGKTSAICRALGLEIADGRNPAPAAVLEVGAGGTTVCEVHIVQGDEYGIQVEPISQEEIRREVREFARFLKEPTSPADEADASEPLGPGETNGTSTEINRAIRNMSGLVGRSRRIRENGKTRFEMEDPARDLADEAENVDSLIAEILARMSLDNRTGREIRYGDSDADSDPLAWLKERFREINYGRAPEFSIPRLITVTTPELTLGDEYATIKVIDTKGIDANSQRGDIESLFGDPNTISVLCSPFNSIPSPSVQNLLQRAAAGKYEIEHKAAILGLPKNDEVEAVKDYSGEPVRDAEEGYILKQIVAESKLKSLGIRDVTVGFFNALHDEPARLRGFMLDMVKNLRERRVADLAETVKDARELVDNFEEEQSLAVRQDAARRLDVWRINNQTLALPESLGVKKSLMDAIDSAHPSSLRASVRREGEWYRLEYSDELGYGARVAAVGVLQSKLLGFDGVAQNILDDPQLEEAHGFVRQVHKAVSDGAEALYVKARLGGVRIHVSMKAPNVLYDLWDLSEGEWGQGPGYRNRVAGHHENWFEGYYGSQEDEIASLISREWSEIMARLSTLLDAPMSAS